MSTVPPSSPGKENHRVSHSKGVFRLLKDGDLPEAIRIFESEGGSSRAAGDQTKSINFGPSKRWMLMEHKVIILQQFVRGVDVVFWQRSISNFEEI